MAIQLWIRKNKRGRFWVQACNKDRSHRGTVGNPGGYPLESTALNVAQHFRTDMDNSLAPGQSVHIFSSRGVRVG